MLIFSKLFLGMGITWYFEILNFALSSLELDPRWLVFTDTLNMCQVTRSQDCSNFIAAGSLGLHHLCLQEECLQGGDWEVEELVQHNRQATIRASTCKLAWRQNR